MSSNGTPFAKELNSAADRLYDLASRNGPAESTRNLQHELRAESERLRRLAESLKAREESLRDMEQNHPYFKEFIYGWLREEALRLPEMTEEQWELERKDALPLEAFIDDLKKAAGVE
jgi:hypothetical protein